MIKYIESEDNKIVKYVNKLKSTKFMKEEKRFIIETFHLLEMADKKDICFILTLEKLEGYNGIDQFIVNEKIMKKLSVNPSFSKVIAVVKMKEENKIEGDLILYLDNLQDPGNIGTLLRTALAFSVKTVISSSYISFYNQKTIQSSQGAIFKLNLLNGDISLLKNLKKEYKLVSTTLANDTIPLKEFKNNDKKVVILGNEGNGISKEIIDISDYKIKIEMGNIDSLNVGVAGGIILYNLKNN